MAAILLRPSRLLGSLSDEFVEDRGEVEGNILK